MGGWPAHPDVCIHVITMAAIYPPQSAIPVLVLPQLEEQSRRAGASHAARSCGPLLCHGIAILRAEQYRKRPIGCFTEATVAANLVQGKPYESALMQGGIHDEFSLSTGAFQQ